MSQPIPVFLENRAAVGAHPPALTLDARTYERGLGCVHCGLCLPACPTYVTTGLEADSPRGRIQLMLGLADGKIAASDSVREHLDLCLDCRACETACPSGVVYHELIEETRAKMNAGQTLGAQGRLMRWLFFNVFARPARLKLALLPARILQKFGVYWLMRKSRLFRLLPTQLRKMEQMLPPTGSLWPRSLPVFTRASLRRPGPSTFIVESSGRGADPARRIPDSSATDSPLSRVGFFAGCIGAVMFDEVNRQAVRLLAGCGADVLAPASQACCGAIHHHNGAHSPARELARRNIDAFMPDDGPAADWITTTVAGCGAMLREYDLLLRDDPKYAQRAARFAQRVRDVSEVLLDLGLPELTFRVDETVTYHDACHLAHAQKVSAAPRALLEKIRGLKLIPLPESDMCCGAAGTYNLTQPGMSARLAERKLANIAGTGAKICATGNVGCAMQIQSQAIAGKEPLKVVHPVELLYRGLFGSSPKTRGEDAASR
ncbi:MAG TPA: heterodisulfide reductase-related iron-sulfur binding cluster [Tepidisphaeraceae bacterium]|nr:heterodisulfide reductase-related iron-sulfur binding cluster [Tepidisphaeraceae bacterium]